MRLIDADKLAEHKFASVEYDRYASDGKRKSDKEIYAYKVGYNEAISDIEQFAPSVESRWIPVTERLPEEDKEVLISYRYKEGEGDTSHVRVDITTYGQMYFGGNKVGNYKHWRAPFEYFESNYEVIAWMPLPEPPEEET